MFKDLPREYFSSAYIGRRHNEERHFSRNRIAKMRPLHSRVAYVFSVQRARGICNDFSQGEGILSSEDSIGN